MAMTTREVPNYWKNSQELTDEFKEYLNFVRDADYGLSRRNHLMRLLELGLEFPINCKHCPQLSQDTDLQKLLKAGKIELVNVREYKTHKKTHVRLKRK